MKEKPDFKGVKAYKVTLLIVDVMSEVNPEEITGLLEDGRYPNHCMSPHVMKIETAEIGDWSDDLPINQTDQMAAEFGRLFPERPKA